LILCIIVKSGFLISVLIVSMIFMFYWSIFTQSHH